ncbi:MAG: arginine--tRNA ligase [Gammaproteobacteria bacterium]|nr:MAG: arginine--tRNA ligase [Gammaproteobacteria bacterium]
MKTHLTELLKQAIDALINDGTLANVDTVEIMLERTKQREHGDFACNLALTLTRIAKCKPRDLAQKIVDALPASDLVDKVEIAGPGFINFFMATSTLHNTVQQVLELQPQYGQGNHGSGKTIHIEFVSANPTGPLHVGHGRGAAYGATLANLLERTGYKVHREYYVNDAGRQMDILAVSVWLRYLELCGEELVFPSNGYQGAYVYDIAAALHRENGDRFRADIAEVFLGISADAGQENGDKEAHIDDLIYNAKKILSDKDYRTVHDAGLDTILQDINKDLSQFGVQYDTWFSERSLIEDDKINKAINQLQKNGYLYKENGALWFKSSEFGDEKDRVVIRENGQATYFASDIAYHLDKLGRGYDQIIDIWGADHHGYVPRIKAVIEAMGQPSDKLAVLLVQFAILYRGGEKVQMSTRSGEFVTLRELRQEVGNDAARFFYVMRKSEQHMDFDLDLAKSQSNDNPVYYIQYAHARICRVFEQLKQKGWSFDASQPPTPLDRLTNDHELDLMNRLSRFPEVIESAAINFEPHMLAQYLRDLANDFHTYYNAHTFLVEDDNLRNARLSLILATRVVIANGLRCLGVSAPEEM